MPKSSDKSHSAPKTKKGEQPRGTVEKRPDEAVQKAVKKPSPKPAATKSEPAQAAKEPPQVPINTGNTRVNFAFPFSKIEVLEPSNELIELTTLVADLVTALAEWVPEEKLVDLRARTEALLGRLSG